MNVEIFYFEHYIFYVASFTANMKKRTLVGEEGRRGVN
jgi:hypothetical protein